MFVFFSIYGCSYMFVMAEQKTVTSKDEKHLYLLGRDFISLSITLILNKL